MKSVHFSEIDGSVLAPPSKSVTIRSLAVALLAEGESYLSRPSFCDDAMAALKIIQALGAEVSGGGEGLSIRGGFPVRKSILGEKRLDCGESGLAMRLFAAVVSLQPHPVWLEATGTLRHRPMDMLTGPLGRLGVTCRTADGFPPVFLTGKMKPGQLVLDASRTSQFLSGLLITLPLLSGDSEIEAVGLRSRPYVELTLETMEKFGVRVKPGTGEEKARFLIPGNQAYHPAEVEVEGDWSGASFLLVAGALAGKIEVTGLNHGSKQADRRILEALAAADVVFGEGEGKITVIESEPRAFDFDATDCPDLFPPLCVLAAHSKGRSRIQGAHRLGIKESDRAQALVQELRRIGVKISREEDSLVIEGGAIRGGRFYSHGDHRMAMAGAIAGLRSREGVEISGSEAIAKSFPGFFEVLKSCGGRVG